MILLICQVEYERLAFVARGILNDSSPRVMAVLDPVVVKIHNFAAFVDESSSSGPRFTSDPKEGAPDEVECTIPNFPHIVDRGNHTLRASSRVYINKSDSSLEKNDDFFGMMEGQVVGLKYLGKVMVDSIKADCDNNVVEIAVTAIAPSDSRRPKSTIQWVPFENSIPATVIQYDHLFKCEEPSDDRWEEDLNPMSKVTKPNALVDPSIFSHSPKPEFHVQFERLGFYVIDRHTSPEACTMLGASQGLTMTFNLTVMLKDSKPKPAGAPSRSRKEEQAAQLAEKMVSNFIGLSNSPY